ncbi:E3 SUMO-protein ligase ZNF451 [Collichthys lucidus]|uniref:E3 SUMO-protein ligase ZNF451 n=1 Tax=Collichthys lucidus TaxID=240159 RepID=A0A4U5VD04_COLLU|nr:E3 SUMO-protein ligase ZNF451 [Collichthys lucidus]
MSSPIEADEDEAEDVEFVSEGPVRPVVECIDLRSDTEDDEGCSSWAGTFEDEITCHRARVSSTLDRLAQQVALEKKERANKCRAFKEKQILQKAHGRQELAFSSTNGINQEAKRCVDMWLKMPGVQPGTISGGFGRKRRSAPFPIKSSTKHTCPVINCGRVYENASLLEGHLKRFDHSPCDPTIKLKGCPSELFACAACGQHFQTKEAWKQHVESKVSSPAPGGHSITQTYQRIVCFACPSCYLFFNLRDECLQHMAASNHFTESLVMNETKERALPVPIPQYVKNRLITLCKDATFSVRCSLCHKVLTSHQAAQAHFNVHCRQGCAVAKADKTVMQVMKQLQVRGQCSLCCIIFLSQTEIERHKESTQHNVEVNQTMEKAVLQYCRFSEIQHTSGAGDALGKRQSASPETPFHKRNKKRSNDEEFAAKRKRLSQSVKDSTSRNSKTAWCCECGLQFSEEAAAKMHLLAVNQIFHQCGVCGKHMGESSITRLHMSRFHGGAHLSNFLFYCRKCKVEMPRYEDILSHVSEDHSGHTYFIEQEVPEELAAVRDAKPSTSTLHSTYTKSAMQQNTVEIASLKAQQTWMCRMCEDVFDSEKDVYKHCSDVSGHSFQRFICGHCPQKFFKESTVQQTLRTEHRKEIFVLLVCGLYCMHEINITESRSSHNHVLLSLAEVCMSPAQRNKEFVLIQQEDALRKATSIIDEMEPKANGCQQSVFKFRFKDYYKNMVQNNLCNHKEETRDLLAKASASSLEQENRKVHSDGLFVVLSEDAFAVCCSSLSKSKNGVLCAQYYVHLMGCCFPLPSGAMQFSSRRRKINANPQTELYGHALQFYGQPPLENISLSEFETFAVDRLKLLKTIENLGVSYVKLSEQYSKKLEAEFKTLSFPYRPEADDRKTQTGPSELEKRRKDHISHFILRLAYCQT